MLPSDVAEERLAEMFSRFANTSERMLSCIHRDGNKTLSDGRTSLGMSFLFALLTVIVWLLGGGMGSLIPLTASGMALILYVEQRASGTGIHHAGSEIARSLMTNGYVVDWDPVRVTMPDAAQWAKHYLSLLHHLGWTDGRSPQEGLEDEAVSAAGPTAEEAGISLSEALAAGAQRFKQHSIFNVGLILAQRPGARALGTERQWAKLGRTVSPDAVPIIILWPFGPVAHLFEVEDTLPPYDRDSIGDPFAVSGHFDPGSLARLETNLQTQKSFAITVRRARTGFSQAGSAAAQGSVPVQGALALDTRSHTAEGIAGKVPSWRINISDRLSAPEQFVTLCHELAHIFCGHLGACNWHDNRELSGWADRGSLPRATQEVEAETVAWIVARRAGLKTGSKQYIEGYEPLASWADFDREVVVRAANRIESLAGIKYGSPTIPRTTNRA